MQIPLPVNQMQSCLVSQQPTQDPRSKERTEQLEG